jgi:hypothetical protein
MIRILIVLYVYDTNSYYMFMIRILIVLYVYDTNSYYSPLFFLYCFFIPYYCLLLLIIAYYCFFMSPYGSSLGRPIIASARFFVKGGHIKNCPPPS